MASTVSGGDWAMAAEVFRRYDADGSGRLDRDELMSALRELGLLTKVSAQAAGRTLQEMDANGDGLVSFEEFREAFSRLAKLRAAEQRQGRIQRSPPAVPPNIATDPRLKAAFALFASWGAAKGLSERAEKSDGLTSRQFQRACTTASLPIDRCAMDVIFTIARKGSQRLSFPRFLDALAQVSLEADVGLEEVLAAVRATAPAAAGAPAKEVDSKLPLSARASRRPKSAGLFQAGTSTAAAVQPTCSQAPVAVRSDSRGAAPLSPAGKAAQEPRGTGTATAASPYNKLQERFASLQQLLESGPDDEGILAHPVPAAGQAAAPEAAGIAGPRHVQQAPPTAPDKLLLNPTFRQTAQGQEVGDFAAFRVEVLSLLDQRCEAAEQHCAALVATREGMMRALLAQIGGSRGSSTAATAQQDALEGLEAKLAALDSQLSEAVRGVALDCRQAVGALEARVEAQQRAQEEALRKVNEALVLIARRVGSLTAAAQQ